MADKLFPLGDGVSFERFKDMGDGTHARVVSVSGLSAGGGVAKLNALAVKPVGFNYYSLMTDRMYGEAGTETARPLNLQYIADTGANMVRVATSAFNAGDYLSRIHNTAQMPSTVTDENLRATFIAACDMYMDALAQYGLMGMHCILFGQAVVPGIFGETEKFAFGNLTSKTTVYAKSMMAWFVNRYKNHAAMGIMSIGNEYTTDETDPVKATTAQLGDWFGAVADVGRAIKRDLIVTANITAPLMVVTGVKTKETMEQSVVRYRRLFKSLDTYCLHIYEYFSFAGHNSYDAGTVPCASYNTFGYEGVESMMQVYYDMSRADNKPLIVGEFGISNANEETDPSVTTAYSTRKKTRLFRSVIPYADVSLVWNVQYYPASVGPNQTTWAIDPQVTTNNRAADFKAIVTAFNNGKPQPRGVGAGLASRRAVVRPTCAIRSLNRGGGINLRFTSTAAHQSSTGYVAMFWVKLLGTLQNGEVMMDFRNTSAPAASSGFAVLSQLAASNLSFYSDGRYNNAGVGASCGNTSNILPDFVINEWHHIAYHFRICNSNGTLTGVTDVWLDGNYWLTVPGISPATAPAPIVIGTTVYAMCNAGNGVPMSMQDITLLPSLLNPQEIWDHMSGVVNPRALLHIRGVEDGTISDLSKNAVALTNGGVTVVIEK